MNVNARDCVLDWAIFMGRMEKPRSVIENHEQEKTETTVWYDRQSA
jgi:hypothetical protein